MLLTRSATLVTLFEQIQDGLTGFRRFCELMDMPSEYQPEHPSKRIWTETSYSTT